MVTSTGSQVETAIFQRVIGSLGSEIEFGAEADVDGSVRAEDRGMGDVYWGLSGREHTEEGAAEVVIED